jgi:hypothetical protein
MTQQAVQVVQAEAVPVLIILVVVQAHNLVKVVIVVTTDLEILAVQDITEVLTVTKAEAEAVPVLLVNQVQIIK